VAGMVSLPQGLLPWQASLFKSGYSTTKSVRIYSWRVICVYYGLCSLVSNLVSLRNSKCTRALTFRVYYSWRFICVYYAPCLLLSSMFTLIGTIVYLLFDNVCTSHETVCVRILLSVRNGVLEDRDSVCANPFFLYLMEC
jgi:hypothetical protein